MNRNISGTYKHYKEGKRYIAFSIANDKYMNKYVLYQQCYGTNDFWIRPYDMFFDSVKYINPSGEEKTVERFKRIGKEKAPDEYIDKLIQTIKQREIKVYHSETGHQYVIASISKEEGIVSVTPFDFLEEQCNYLEGQGGYITQYELIRRMGKNCCLIDQKLEVWDANSSIMDAKKLIIQGYSNEDIKMLINPCSIDFRIAETGFLKTRLKTVDPQSIEHATKASDLWRSVKLKKSRDGKGEYFKLWPGQTVLTHVKNRIKLPVDCAGKIEIKSSYARLSLSITSGDFCNPGYDGFYPLEITNHGNHIIILHAGSVMGQLMLIPVVGPILEEYSKKATQKNKEKGYDDGTPYTFWLENSIKRIRRVSGYESIINIYEKLRKEIQTDRVDDVNASKERFDDNFLSFCQNKLHKEKYKSLDERLPDIRKLLNGYMSHEKLIKRLYSIRWLTGIGGAIGFIYATVGFIFQGNEKAVSNSLIQWYKNIPQSFKCLLFIVPLVFLLVSIILHIRKPKSFCTFEKIDMEKVLSETKKN